MEHDGESQDQKTVLWNQNKRDTELVEFTKFLKCPSGDLTLERNYKKE